MKFVIASDIHGSAYWCRKLMERFELEQADRMLLLGDLLYHGPRNALPGKYDAKKAAEMLNIYKKKIIAVRGNCDSEVDQMMLEFPCLADFSTIYADGIRFFLTHGHLWNEGNPPQVTDGTILAHGHTHIPVLKKTDDGKMFVFNPGSIAIPKGGSVRTYGTWEDGMLSVRELANGNVFNGLTMKFL